MTEYAFCSQGVDRWRKEMALTWGISTSGPLLQWFHIPSLTPTELSSLTSLNAGGEKQRVCHNITFLLVVAEEEATGDIKIWSIDHMGKPLSGQGPLHGGSGWESDCLGLQWT